jgi:hypothetical protein
MLWVYKIMEEIIYSLEDKVLALSIFKQSGKGCRIFSLPSNKILTTLLRNVPLAPGINKHIFEPLQKTVGKLNIRTNTVFSCLMK